MNKSHVMDCLDTGRGRAVLLLHDALLAPDSWDDQIAQLEQADFRVIVPDLSGCAHTEDIATYADAVVSLLNRLGIGRVAACGTGMGGLVLFALLERISPRIVGAGFINTRPGPDDVQEKLKRAEIILDLEHGNDTRARGELLRMLFGGREKYLCRSVRKKIRDRISDCDRQLLLGQLKAMQARKNYLPLLSSFALPTLIISGRDDRICHPGYSEIMENQLSNCSESVTLDGGHLIQYEKAALVSAKLVAFLRALAPPQPARVRSLCSLRAA